MNRPCVVLDTNLLVSYALNPGPTVTQAVCRALDACVVLISQETFDELRAVMARFALRGYVTDKESAGFLAALVEVAEWVKVLEAVEACRDPDDDKFLALAVNGQADCLVTGDKDLLALHPFRGVSILTDRDFLSISF